MARVAWEPLAWFGHETGCYAEFAANGFYHVSGRRASARKLTADSIETSLLE